MHSHHKIITEGYIVFISHFQNSTAQAQKKWNVGDDYSQDFPAIFNIILFMMIGLFLSTLGIAYCMWFMDPGRDSIIYRMTSQRIKKDS